MKKMFGCGAFEAVEYVKSGKQDEKLGLLMKEWLDLFDYGTLPFYWGRYEPVEGQPDQENLMAAAKFLKENGVKVKGHPLCWHTVCADWLLK